MSTAGLIHANQRLTHPFVIEPGIWRIDVQATWPGSDIDLALTGPDGTSFDTASAVRGGFGSEGETYDTLSIRLPAPGEWQVVAIGTEIAARGEPYDVRVTSRFPAVRARWRIEPEPATAGAALAVRVETTPAASLRSMSARWTRDERDAGTYELPGDASGAFRVPVPSEAGTYRLRLVANGATGRGKPFMRTFDRTLPVIDPRSPDAAARPVARRATTGGWKAVTE